jgi:hypothetical protein
MLSPADSTQEMLSSREIAAWALGTIIAVVLVVAGANYELGDRSPAGVYMAENGLRSTTVVPLDLDTPVKRPTDHQP